jgi:membrane-bound serine protease (ClpP class)
MFLAVRDRLQARRRPRRRVLLLAALTSLLGLALLAGPAGAQGDERILATEVRGVITPVIANHLEDALEAAEAGGYHALLVELDTPGGLEDAMRDIVKTFLPADIPVIVHVTPSGARAASAGAIMTFASHVAVMAPGTNIGAATPVPLEGELPEELANKIIQDSAAYAEAIAQMRGRDVDFVVDTVREGASASANEALEIGAIDLISPTRESLLEDVDGISVFLNPRDAEDPEGTGTEVVLATDGATVDEFEMSFTRDILQALANPNLALIFLSLGPLAILYELASPGAIIPGVIGAVMLILGFFSLAVLPVNIAGILLLLIAIALFITELFVPGVGVFAGAGAIALIAAGIFLFEQPTGVGVDLSFLIPIALAVGLAAVFIGRFAWRIHRTRPYTGQGGSYVGAVGEVREAHGQTGRVWVNGQMWRARTQDGDLRRGERVEVRSVEGLELVVAPVQEDSPTTTPER